MRPAFSARSPCAPGIGPGRGRVGGSRLIPFRAAASFASSRRCLQIAVSRLFAIRRSGDGRPALFASRASSSACERVTFGCTESRSRITSESSRLSPPRRSVFTASKSSLRAMARTCPSQAFMARLLLGMRIVGTRVSRRGRPRTTRRPGGRGRPGRARRRRARRPSSRARRARPTTTPPRRTTGPRRRGRCRGSR